MVHCHLFVATIRSTTSMPSPLIRRAKISAVGMYTPEGRLTNADFESRLDTSDEWITTRTGIKERRIVQPGQASSDLALLAARQVLEGRGLSPEDLEVIVFATVSPDRLVPATACILQQKLGARNAWGFDIDAACCGFLYALTAGEQLIRTGLHDRVLVVGADVMSTIADYEDRTTCILFGDAAGAVLLEPAGEGEDGIIDHLLQMDGTGSRLLKIPAGGSRRPATEQTVRERLHYLQQDGRQVFKFAVETMASVCVNLLQKTGYRAEQVALFVPHQANLRIIESAARRLGLPRERIWINIDRYGNTTTATIPTCLAEAHQQGRVKKGELVLLSAVGAGFTWGASLLRWELG